MEILTVQMDDLVPDPANPRAHSTENIEAIKASLKRFGQVLPLLVRDADCQVVAGNGTLQAMRDLGYTECNVALYDGSDEECKALSVALNRTAELATWDGDNLGRLVHELQATGFAGMDALGFSPQALDDLVRDFGTLDGGDTGAIQDQGPVAEDEVPEPCATALISGSWWRTRLQDPAQPSLQRNNLTACASAWRSALPTAT